MANFIHLLIILPLFIVLLVTVNYIGTRFFPKQVNWLADRLFGPMEEENK